MPNVPASIIPLPPNAPRSAGISCCLADGTPCDVAETGTGPAVFLRAPDGFEVELIRESGWDGVRVCPASANANSEIHGTSLRIAAARSLLLEMNNTPVAYVVIVPPSEGPPQASGKLLRFQAGETVDAGTITMESGDVLWIEQGAWVRGHVVASEAHGIFIGGGGVLEAAIRHPSGEGVRAIVLDHCREAVVDNLTITNGHHWMLSVGACENVRIKNTRQFSRGGGTDGIDIVGSRGVTVSDCFLRNGDDNFAIKALNVKSGAYPGQSSAGNYRGDWDAAVGEILIERCAIYNDHGGTAMEIGYETRTERIANVTFRDIDVMGVHEFGSVFGIHNGDRAIVENITWENIRVEHHYDKLVDFRIVSSRWNTDPQRGQIRNILLRNMDIVNSPYNAGYTVSLIGGFNGEHTVEGVRFEDVRLGGSRVLSADQLSLFTRAASGISFV